MSEGSGDTMANHSRRRTGQGGLSSRPAAPAGRLPGYRPSGYRSRASLHTDDPVTRSGALSRLGRVWSGIGRFPAMIGGMFLGALIPWAVNAYAPRAVEQVSGTPVLQVSAGYDQDRLSDGWTAALAHPVPPAGVPPDVDSCAALRRWGLGQGAADVYASGLLLSFDGTRLEPVSVTSVRVVVDSRSDVYSGTHLTCPSAGSGDAIPVGISLDEAYPVFRELNEDGTLGGPWFSSNTLTLSRGELVTFAVTAYAAKAAYTWHLEAVVRSDSGEQTVVRVPGNFATTGVSSSYHDYLTWRWDLQPPELKHSNEPDSVL